MNRLLKYNITESDLKLVSDRYHTKRSIDLIKKYLIINVTDISFRSTGHAALLGR